MRDNYRYQHLVRQDCPLPAGSHVIAYCRDSGGEEQDRSVAQQKAAMAEYCDRHQLILEHVYLDEARSGSDTEKRAAFNQMLGDIAARFPQVRNLKRRNALMLKAPFGLLCWKSSRLGRDSLDATHNKADIRLRGVMIIPMTASIETGDPAMNAMLESIQQVQDEKFLEALSEESRRGLAENVTLRDNDPEFRALNPEWATNDGRYLGVHPGPLPRGFRAERILVSVRERKGRNRGGEPRYVQRMVPDRESGLWDRCYLAWKMRHEGAPIKKILAATKLYKNVAGYEHFFENPIYIGTLVYGGQTIEDFVEPLIPLEWWRKEQERREVRASKLRGRMSDPMYEPRRVASRHLLSGLVYCGAVAGEEHPMTADTVPAKAGKRSRWDFYICSTKKNSRDHACQASRVGAKALDQAVIEVLMRDVLTLENLHPIVQALGNALSDRNQDVMIRIHGVKQRLDEIQQSIQQLLDAIEAVGISTNLQARLRDREAEERKLITELVNLEDMLVKPQTAHQMGEQQLQEWIEKLRQELVSGDIDVARRAIRQFVAKIVVNEKAGTLYYVPAFIDASRLYPMTPTGLEPVF